MKPRQKFARSSARSQWRRPLAIATASVAAVALGAVGMTVPTEPAAAEPTDDSAAQAQLIHGSVLEGLDAQVLSDLLAAVTTSAGNPSDPGPNSADISLSALGSTLNVDVGSISVPLIGDGSNGGLLNFGPNAEAGLLNGYAASPSGQESTAASGALGADGAINTDAGGSTDAAHLDLTALLGQLGIDGLTDTVVDQFEVQLGALASRAQQAQPDGVTSEYLLAGAKLQFHSPLVAGLSSDLQDGVTTLESTVNGVLGPDGAVQQVLDGVTPEPVTISNPIPLGDDLLNVDLGSPTVNATVDLSSVTNTLLTGTITSTDQLVSIDLSTGAISVDLAQLHNGNLNGLPANTNLLTTGEIDQITQSITGLLNDAIDDAVADVETALLNSAVTVSFDPTLSGIGGAVSGDLTAEITGTLGDFLGLSGASPTVNVDGEVTVLGITLDAATLGDAIEPVIEAVLPDILGAFTNSLLDANGDVAAIVALQGALSAVLDGLSPLNQVLEQLLTLTVNAQEQPGDLADDSFTVRALSVELLPNLAEGVVLDLGSSTVRATALQAVTITSPADGQEFTITPGQTGIDVPVSGTGEPGSTVTVTVDGTDYTATVGEDGTWTVTATDVPAGDHTATATQTVDGATSTDSVTFVVNPPANADSYTPAYSATPAIPGQEATSDAPTFTDAGGGTVVAPEGTTFALGSDAPADATIDANTGVITWTPSTANAGETVQIPVLVTYPDGTTDTADAPFEVGSLADAYIPEYSETPATVGQEAVSDAPTFTDTEGTVVEPPADATYALGADAPADATIDPATGVITWTPGVEDANQITDIPVEVTYSDESVDQVTAPFNVGAVPQADAYDPAYSPTQAVPGQEAVSETPTFTDASGAAVTPPTGTSYALGADAPASASVDEATGAVTFTPGPETANSTVNVPVVVTYPDDTTDSVDAPFEVGSLADAYTPAYTATPATVGTPATSDAPTFTAGGADVAAPADATYALGAGAPANATIDSATGEVTWTPAASEAGTTVDIPVEVTYADESVDEVLAPFDVQEFNGNASASAAASANADDNSNASAQAAAQAAALADATSDASAAADSDATAAAAAAAQADASTDASADVSSDANASSAAAANAAANADNSSATNADSSAAAEGNAAAAADAAAIADASTDASADAAANANAASNANANAASNANADQNANASASAAASANADDNSNASAQAAAQAAALADATSDASAAADSDATAAAAAAAQADASTDASADVSSDANASSAAAANAAANADNSSATNADSSAAAEGNAAAAADAAAIADASTDASANAAANADASSAANANADQQANANADQQADSTADSDANANAAASAAASANADDNSNAAAQAAAQAAALADATSDASAAADSDATSAAQAAANQDASMDASADVSSDANASAAAAADAAANADNSAATNADASAAAEGNAAAAADAAAIADASSNASGNAAGAEQGELEATVKYATIVRGTGVTQEVYGTGFEPGESVTATVHSTPFDLEAVTADENGQVTFTFDVGSDFELGDHHVTLVGATSGEVPAANTHTDFTVVDSSANATATANGGTAADGGDSGWLPDTGSTIGPGVLLGAFLLILLGSGLALVAHRRRGQQH